MNMKRYILLLTGTIGLLTACREEQLNVYDGDNYAHFTYMDDKSPQTVTFNFATDAPLAREGKVAVRLTLWGYLPQTDASYRVSVVEEKTTARLHTDYEPLATGIFHAGQAEDVYEVSVKRNEELLHTDYTLTLSLDEMEHCLIGPAGYRQATIRVTDQLTQPVWWNQSAASRLGVYSAMKYRVFILFMKGEILESLDRYTGIEFAQLISDFKSWWQQEWAKGNYRYYDTDGKTPLYETILDR